ncbi:MAG: recombinase family protein [Xanthobacteraceae bacterium]
MRRQAEVVCRLLHRRHTYIKSLFGAGTVHEILTRTAYAGVREFNAVDRETSERKRADEIVSYEVPLIIDDE